jgi:anti-sigma factor RsiW
MVLGRFTRIRARDRRTGFVYALRKAAAIEAPALMTHHVAIVEA